MLEKKPCKPDHNGECLVCDCWVSNCAWDRLFAGDFRHESFEELMKMFDTVLTEQQKRELRNVS
jgi:hypothetical protein